MKGHRCIAARMALALAAAISVQSAAQQQAAPAAASIDDASWLAGRWVGTGLGGEIEEVWSPPQGGQMIGHFALRREGRPVFYELLMIDVAEAGGIRMRVKHFNPDFTAWEDRDGWHTFDPHEAAPRSIRMNGLWLRLDGEELVIAITLRDRASGTSRDHELRLRRAPL